jgi:hypothetical protein
MVGASKARPPNFLLAALARKDYVRLLPEFEAVPITVGELLFEPPVAPRHQSNLLVSTRPKDLFSVVSLNARRSYAALTVCAFNAATCAAEIPSSARP